ncbi:MAG TPA: DUF1566 domain-containing protein [Candidatus Binataceae bacterium]|nr:DUF1566 domain-containing protein [Candidatus Binataceae bacterium]
MYRINLTVMALCVTLLWVGTVQAKPTPPPPNPTLVCQQRKLAAQGRLQLCLALNSANILKGAPDNSAACYQGLTKALALIDAAAAKAGTACRYVDNGDGTVTDNKTGLMWEQTTGTIGGTNTGKINDVNNRYAWSTGGNLADGTAFTSFLATLNNGASTDGGVSTPITGCFANHCDWRLPSIVELQGIIDFNATGCLSEGSPCIDPIFGPTQSGGYWSATTYAGYAGVPGIAWFVDFDNGLVGDDYKTFAGSVRAVRGGS